MRWLTYIVKDWKTQNNTKNYNKHRMEDSNKREQDKEWQKQANYSTKLTNRNDSKKDDWKDLHMVLATRNNLKDGMFACVMKNKCCSLERKRKSIRDDRLIP